MFTTLKLYAVAILTVFLLGLGIYGYVKVKHYFNPPSKPTIQQVIQTKKDEANQAEAKAKDEVAKIKARVPVASLPAISVGSVLTPEVIDEIQTRERDDLKTIDDLQIVVAKKNEVIAAQDKYIIRLERKVTIWKVVSGVLTVVILKIYL
jgi:hypothetical protein